VLFSGGVIMRPLEGNSTKNLSYIYFMVAMLKLHVFRNDIIWKNADLNGLKEGKIVKIFATEYNLVLKIK